MRFLLVFMFFVTTYIQGNAVNPRSINLNLDTSFVVDQGDEDKATLLDKVKKIFDKIKEFFEKLHLDDVIIKKKEKIKDAIEDSRFLNAFFKKTGNSALKYKKDVIKDLAIYVADEVATILDQNEEFSDTDFRKSVDRKIKRLSSMKGKKLKATIKRALKAKSEKIQNFERKFSDFYDERDKSKLERLISRMEEKTENRKTLRKLVKDVFSVLFHEKYDRLDKSSKRKFIKEIRELLLCIDIDSYSRRMNDDSTESKANSDSTTVGASKESKKISFKKDIEIVVNTNSEEADT